jgi:hypothetical protein
VTRRAALAAVLLAACGRRAEAAPILLGRSVVGSGGGVSSGSGRTLTGTVGQAAVGLSAGAGNRVDHGFWGAGGYLVLAADPPPGAPLPATLALGRAFPNPSRGAVNLELAMPRSGEVRLIIFDVAGRRTDEYRAGSVGAGLRRVTWQPPPGMTGVYFARVLVDGRALGERRVVLTR